MSEVVNYDLMINGFPVKATYVCKDIEEIFMPLIDHMIELHKQYGRRILVFLAAPPAVGKSTLAEMLAVFAKEKRNCSIQAIGLDGFHYPTAYIQEHTVERDGMEVPMRDVKGCPETFDIKKITEALRQMKTQDIRWPIYDRNLHDVVADQIEVKQDIILIEGNWLLLDETGWRDLKALCDYSIFIRADESLLKERLINRKMQGGLSYEEALAFYLNSDGRNVIRVLENSQRADLTLTLSNALTYEMED